MKFFCKMMNLRKIFVFGTIAFIFVCLALFYLLTSSITSRNLSDSSAQKLDYAQIETKLKTLEEAVMSHRISLQQVEKDLERGGGGNSREKMEKCSSSVGITPVSQGVKTKMSKLYEEIKFDNEDGGVWKQGWNIEIDEKKFSKENKLKVFVIPHSHNDPGWIKTFERYFQDQTKAILDSMFFQLMHNPEMKFIWAEISYFDLWWRTLDGPSKLQVKKLVKNKQLEFVTGGWVMPDESSSHYFSIVSQIIEGNQWLYHHLNATPTNGWSIDPFGMSSTNAYILKRSGFENMLIQRTHYEVKKALSRAKELEFIWRQSWDGEGRGDILCHMMPFFSYDIPHSCGPDPKICCTFDFTRMRGVSSFTCPWGIQPTPILRQNVKERSSALLGQYRKKSMLYKTNTLLVPLGDDFRWGEKVEWEAQMKNYNALMEFINGEEEFNAHVQWGTLDDYFKEMRREGVEMEKLDGDFFTYADRADHYWSGYFTSRPFHKAADRELMARLRAAHISYALMSSGIYKKERAMMDSMLMISLTGQLMKARRTLSLFQHHDGIAGTSKDHVMEDYAQKMYSALKSCDDVLQKSLYYLIQGRTSEQYENDVFLVASVSRQTSLSLPSPFLIVLDEGYSEKLVTVFNSLPRTGKYLVRLHVSTYNVKVYDKEGNLVESEIVGVFEEKMKLSRNVFELQFVAEVSGLSVRNYFLKFQKNNERSHPEMFIINPTGEIFDQEGFPIKVLENTEEVQISNGHYTLKFDENGFLKTAEVGNVVHILQISMNSYDARHRHETSGLYLFLPGGPSKKLRVLKPFIRVIKGKFEESVEVWLDNIKHQVVLYKTEDIEKYGIEIRNKVDIRKESNFELVMKFKTDIESGDVFYTELNAFQMMRRKRYSKIPLQGNFYPIPSSAFIEDSQRRLTLLTGQPLGGSSLKSGEFEIVLDRRLMQDDERGAAQGDTDNLLTSSIFRLLIETPLCEEESRGLLSLQSQIMYENLLHPPPVFIGSNEMGANELQNREDFKFSKSEESGCEVQLVDLSPLPDFKDFLDDESFFASGTTGIIVRKLGYDGRFIGDIPLPSSCSINQEIKLSSLVGGELFSTTLEEKSLNFVHRIKEVSLNESLELRGMELYAYEAQFKE